MSTSDRKNGAAWLRALSLSLLLACSSSALAQTVAGDLREEGALNLTSFSQEPAPGAFGSAGDGFEVFQRGVSASIPFSLVDDTLSVFPADTLGIVGEADLDPFFGATDTRNGDNPTGASTATWVFNVAGSGPLNLSIDMAAMGDFETSDTFTWSYSIDGGVAVVAFESSVDEAASQDYTLDSGTLVTLNDPVLVDGTLLNNDFQTFTVPVSGQGAELALTLSLSTDGGSEAFAFRDIELTVAEPLAFTLRDSSSKNLVSYTNPFADGFTSAGDGFRIYQRGVSATIPFAVLDDSLSVFPADSLGIIGEANTDEFFGVVDTVNSDTTDPVTASWEFDITGGEQLGVSIDMGAMGDFEASDSFTWRYSIDGSDPAVLFEGVANEAGTFTYTLDGGASFTLNDPMEVDGETLTNTLATFTKALPADAAGSILVLSLEAIFNGGDEAVAFQNILINTGVAGEEPPPPPPVLEIWEVQGSGEFSPFEGDVVDVPSNIVTAIADNGFFMQTPMGVRDDMNVDTSNGIFVFTDTAPAVAVGDEVSVVAEVDEFFGLTQLREPSVLTVLTSGNMLPEAVVFDESVPSRDPSTPSCAIEYECYENMLITMPVGNVGGPNQSFGSDPVAEVFISAGVERAFREPGIEFPGVADIPVWDGNPEVFELDADRLGLPFGIIDVGTTFSATGILGFEFGDYELWPTALTPNEPVPPEPVRPRERAEFTVASLNLLNLFDDIDDPAEMTSQGRTRDDVGNISTDEYMVRRAKFVDYIVNTLDAPDVLGVQEVESLKVLEDLAGDISLAHGISYSAFLEEGNDVRTIDVGFLVRDTVAVDAVTQLGKDTILSFDGSLLNDRPPLLLEGRSVGDGADYPFAVIVVHSRSLSSIQSERTQIKRLEQAQFLAAEIQALQTANPDIRLIVTGDFNGFEFSDGYADVLGQIVGEVDPTAQINTGDDLVDPNLINQVLSVPPEERYSFIFNGNAQVLDHALTSMALDQSTRGLAFGRGNADGAEILLDDPNTPLASSDHDGLVLFISKDIDNDGVNDDADLCPATVIPETLTRRLLPFRYALLDDDFVFDTQALRFGRPPVFTTEDTGGCSCGQIADRFGLGKWSRKFGCSRGLMRFWTFLVERGAAH